MNPQLTVLTTVYNGSPYLRTAFDSILQQTYSNFRFLIVDDGSTDESREIVSSYRDPRIELLCLDRNVGQTAALNIGLRRASTPWIARMDQDDYSAATRLEEQMRALDADPSLSCIGTYCWTFTVDPRRAESMVVYPVVYEELRRALLRGAPMAHPSIVLSRTALLDIGGYNERYRYSADLEMYDRLLARYRAANVPKALVGLRQHDHQGSSSRMAVEEGIEIYCRRLRLNNYSSKDVALVRAGLAALYFERARHWIAERNYAALAKDIREAYSASAKTFLWHCIRLVALLLLPARVQSATRRLLAHRLSRFA